jgi:hypothetical protein
MHQNIDVQWKVEACCKAHIQEHKNPPPIILIPNIPIVKEDIEPKEDRGHPGACSNGHQQIGRRLLPLFAKDHIEEFHNLYASNIW